jgi:hypothetical protein
MMICPHLQRPSSDDVVAEYGEFIPFYNFLLVREIACHLRPYRPDDLSYAGFNSLSLDANCYILKKTSQLSRRLVLLPLGPKTPASSSVSSSYGGKPAESYKPAKPFLVQRRSAPPELSPAPSSPAGNLISFSLPGEYGRQFQELLVNIYALL